jgi:RNA polymerase sigma-70 factor (ECF subfamily)
VTEPKGELSADRLMPEVYQQLRAVAGSYFRSQPAGLTLQPTALLHEAYLRLARAEKGGVEFRDQEHFCAVAARAMRQVLVDASRRRSASRRGGGLHRVTLSVVATSGRSVDVDLLDLDQALEELHNLSPRQARIVELRYFAGLTVPEVAAVLDIAISTVERDWRQARAWLAVTLGRDSES